MKKKARPITEIIKDADTSMLIDNLIDLWGEIVKNKYNYTLAKIWGAGHHIAELALKAQGEDIEKGKFYNWLKSMCK